MLLEFKRVNSSGWLTNYRLIQNANMSQGHLEGHTPEIYALKDLKKAQESTLIVHFKGKLQAIITLPTDPPALLQEIKDYIEKATKLLHKKSQFKAFQNR